MKNFIEHTVHDFCDMLLCCCCREVHLINIIITTVAAVVEFNIKVYDHIIIIYIWSKQINIYSKWNMTLYSMYEDF